MFHLTQPSAEDLEKQIAAANRSIADEPRLLSLDAGLRQLRLPFGYFHDHTRFRIGLGQAAFVAAKWAFKAWAPFDIGWVRVANPEALIAVGQIVAVEARTLGLWTLNFSRIAETIDTSTWYGFLYVTTKRHVEQGEERFLLQFNPTTGEVWYELEAISRPRQTLARLGLPVTRAFQHRFARDSQQRVRAAVLTKGS